MIHVFGSINLDLVVAVPRLPAEGETVLGPGYRALPGGKGANQALAAARAGADVCLSACTGADAFADLALAELRVSTVNLGDLRGVDAPTGCAFIAVDEEGRNQIVVAAGANAALRADAAARACLSRAGTLLLQMEVPTAQSFELATAAKAAGTRVLLNVAPAGALPESVLQAVDWLLLNEGEACAVAAAAGLAATDGASAGAALAAHTGRGVVVTRGAAGALALVGDRRIEVDAMPVTVVDTVGAGDAFCGCFAAALDTGADLATALGRAAVAGSLACTVRGAQPSLPNRAAIDAALGGPTAVGASTPPAGA